MRSRFLATGLAFLSLLGPLPAAAATYADAFQFLSAAGAISGSDVGDPNVLISRGDVLRILLDGQQQTRARIEWHRKHLSSLPLFLDVASNDPLAPYAEAAFALGITTGFPDRTLRPSAVVSAEEAITLLMRAYRQTGETSDNDTAWYASFIRGALGKNLIDNPRSMRVGQAVTRGRFFDMAYRMGVITRDNLAAFPTAGGGAVAGASGGATLAARPTDDQGTLAQFRSSRDFAITIPSLGITDLVINHPEDSQSKDGLLAPLREGVGHLFAYPGRGGKIMVYGHSSGYSWDVSEYTKIFRQVNRLKEGDKVYVTFNGALYEYAVTGQETITPNDKKPFMGEGEELILYTCWPPNSIKKRLIVRAVPVETVAVR